MAKKNQKSFIVLSKSWYGPANLQMMAKDRIFEEIHLGVDDSIADITLHWMNLTDKIVGIKLEIFDDGWKCFEKCPELFKLLSDCANKNVSPEFLTKKLLKLGFVDKTRVNQA